MKYGINAIILVVILSGIACAKNKIPEGFWTAPVSYTSYANGFGKDITPDILFRKVKFKTIDSENGIIFTSRIIERSIKGNKITFIIESTKNKKTTLRVVTTLVYNKDQQTNYVDSVFIKNYINNTQLKFVNHGSSDDLNYYTADNMGQVVGAFWSIMSNLLDTDELKKLMTDKDNKNNEDSSLIEDYSNTSSTE